MQLLRLILSACFRYKNESFTNDKIIYEPFVTLSKPTWIKKYFTHEIHIRQIAKSFSKCFSENGKNKVLAWYINTTS